MDVWKFQVDQSSRFAETFLTYSENREKRVYSFGSLLH